MTINAAASLSTSTSTPNNKSSNPSSSATTNTAAATSALPPAPYIPRRTLLYVPGDDVRKLRKATQLQCDFIALDCEDGVAVSRKQVARDTIRSFYDSNLNEVPSRHESYRNTEWSVRLNSWSSGLCEEDLRAVTGGKRVPETLLLPKCETSDELEEVYKIHIYMLAGNVQFSNPTAYALSVQPHSSRSPCSAIAMPARCRIASP